jgi:hypothetical protein
VLIYTDGLLNPTAGVIYIYTIGSHKTTTSVNAFTEAVGL